MKATLDLPDHLLRDVKLRAVLENRSLKDLVAELLQQGLTQPTHRTTRPTRGDIKLPLIQCGHHAPARNMNRLQLQKLIHQADEEDDRAHIQTPL